MDNPKKPISKLSLSILYSLSESYTILPFMIYSALITEEATVVNFFLPVIIIYSVQRACLVALRGFGEITNPYRILKSGVIIALIGALMMILSAIYQPLLLWSALLIGVGLSPFRAMFIPLSASLIESNSELKKSKGVGTIIYLVVMLIVLAFDNSALPIVQILFLIYISIALWILLHFDGDSLFNCNKAFDYTKNNPVYFVFGILALLTLLILRQYKQSSVSVLVWLTPVMLITFIALEVYRRRNYKSFSYKTYWVGSLKCYLMLFSLIYHSSIGNTSMALLIYLAISISSFLTIPAKKVLKKIPSSKLNNLSMILSAILSFSLVFPSRAINLIGLTLAEVFGNIVSAESGGRYMSDERHVKLDRPLTRLRIQTAGSIISQLVMFYTIYFLGEIGVHHNLLEAYAAGNPDPSITLLLNITGLICSFILLISAILIIAIADKKEGGVK